MGKLPADFIKTAKMCGLEHLTDSQGHFYVEKNRVLSSQSPAGVTMTNQEKADGVEAQVVVEKNAKIKEPLFFCFGVLGQKDEQQVIPNLTIQDGAEVTIVAHCSFPHATDVRHDMKARFVIGQGAKLTYQEHHYHGPHSGAQVTPKLKVEIDEGGQFVSNFVLSKGSVGQVKIEVSVELQKDAQCQIESKVLGKSAKDQVEIYDKVVLAGAGSKSLIKMRAAAVDGGQVLMQGETYANAAGARGHVDCQEIVVGQGSMARAVPIVEVNNDEARVTHEASVGKINQKELETLMTRGLSEEEATELIIEAMMR